MSRLLWLSALATSCVIGCGESPDSSESASLTQPKQATLSPGFRLQVSETVYHANSDDSDGTDFNLYKDPSTDLINEQFKRLKWGNSLAVKGITLDWKFGDWTDYSALTINGTLNPTSPDEQLRAELSEPSTDGNGQVEYVSEPLVTTEIALKLLLSFHKQDGKYKSLVIWKERQNDGG